MTRTRTVAAALNVDPDRLSRFARFHPDPDLEDVLALADRPPVDDDTRSTIRAWLADVRDLPDPDDLPGATHHLDRRAVEDVPVLDDHASDRGGDGA